MVRSEHLCLYNINLKVFWEILHDKQCRNYWKKIFADIEINWIYVDTLADGTPKLSDYFEAVRGKKPLLPGAGSKLLETTLEKTHRYPLKADDFTEPQLAEWNEIGKKIFSWTCCSKRKV